MDCAEAIAHDLLYLVRSDLQPELTLRQWRRKCYNQIVVIKTMRKQLLMLRSGRQLGKH